MFPSPPVLSVFPSSLGVASLQGLVDLCVPQLVWPAYLQRPLAPPCGLSVTPDWHGTKKTNQKGGGPFKVEVRLRGREPPSLCLCETLPYRVCSSAVFLWLRCLFINLLMKHSVLYWPGTRFLLFY